MTLHIIISRFEKSKTGPSGGSPSQWVHFEKVSQVLGQSKSINFLAQIEESTSN